MLDSLGTMEVKPRKPEWGWPVLLTTGPFLGLKEALYER